jgi:hypothetical protein
MDNLKDLLKTHASFNRKLYGGKDKHKKNWIVSIDRHENSVSLVSIGNDSILKTTSYCSQAVRVADNKGTKQFVLRGGINVTYPLSDETFDLFLTDNLAESIEGIHKPIPRRRVNISNEFLEHFKMAGLFVADIGNSIIDYINTTGLHIAGTNGNALYYIEKKVTHDEKLNHFMPACFSDLKKGEELYISSQETQLPNELECYTQLIKSNTLEVHFWDKVHGTYPEVKKLISPYLEQQRILTLKTNAVIQDLKTMISMTSSKENKPLMVVFDCKNCNMRLYRQEYIKSYTLAEMYPSQGDMLLTLNARMLLSTLEVIKKLYRSDTIDLYTKFNGTTQEQVLSPVYISNNEMLYNFQNHYESVLLMPYHIKGMGYTQA